MTDVEVAAQIAAYNADRCPCGGSPPWMDSHESFHAVDWHLEHGWQQGIP